MPSQLYKEFQNKAFAQDFLEFLSFSAGQPPVNHSLVILLEKLSSFLNFSLIDCPLKKKQNPKPANTLIIQKSRILCSDHAPVARVTICIMESSQGEVIPKALLKLPTDRIQNSFSHPNGT